MNNSARFTSDRLSSANNQTKELRKEYYIHVANIVMSANFTSFHDVQKGNVTDHYAIYAQKLPDNKIVVVENAKKILVVNGFNQDGSPQETGVYYTSSVAKDLKKVESLNKMVAYAKKTVLAIKPEHQFTSEQEKQAYAKNVKQREELRESNPKYKTYHTPRGAYPFESRKELKGNYAPYVNISVQAGQIQNIQKATIDGKQSTYFVFGALPDNRTLIFFDSMLHVVDGFDNQRVPYFTGIHYSDGYTKSISPAIEANRAMVKAAKVVVKRVKDQAKQQGYTI